MISPTTPKGGPPAIQTPVETPVKPSVETSVETPGAGKQGVGRRKVLRVVSPILSPSPGLESVGSVSSQSTSDGLSPKEEVLPWSRDEINKWEKGPFSLFQRLYKSPLCLLTYSERNTFLMTGHLPINLSGLTLEPPEEKAAWIDAVYSVCESALISYSESCLTRLSPVVSLIGQGCSGAYCIRTPLGEPLAIFKPRNEEMGGVHHREKGSDIGAPKKFAATATCVGVGHGFIFERVAFRIAREVLEASCVPHTVCATVASHCFSTIGCETMPVAEDLKKQGALQQFCKGECGSKLSCKEIEEKTSEYEFALMIAFDLMTYCVDRNLGNVIVGEENNLYLIDHSALFATDFLASLTHFWISSKAANQPFPSDIASKILSIEEDHVCSIIREEFASHGVILDLDYLLSAKICLNVLQEGIRWNLTPCEIRQFYECDKTEGFGGESIASYFRMYPLSVVRDAMKTACTLKCGFSKEFEGREHIAEAIWKKPFFKALLMGEETFNEEGIEANFASMMDRARGALSTS